MISKIVPDLAAATAGIKDGSVVLIGGFGGAGQPHELIDALIQQIASPVRWEDVVKRLESEGVTRYVEVGPGKALSGMIKRIVTGAVIHNVEGPGDLAAVEGLF